MIKIGTYNTLRIAKRVDFGLYLDGGDEGEILLPTRYVPQGANIGDELEVKVNEIDAQGRINLIRNDIVYSAPEFTRREGGNRRPPRRSENSNHD
jgi:predicted RNA-binding protein (virulence factor B family)